MKSADGRYSAASAASNSVTPAVPLSVWTTRSTGINSVVLAGYGNGNFLISGNNGSGTINKISTDVITWTTVTTTLTAQAFSIAYGNGVWVMGGQYGQVSRSTNAVSWTSQNAFFEFASGQQGNVTSPVRGMAYGNGVFLAVGAFEGLRIRTSTDGITWVSRANGSPSGFANDAEYGNGIWVIVGGGNSGFNSFRSTDTITWTTHLNTSSTSVAYGNGTWVAVAGA